MKNSDTALTIVLPVARQFEKTRDSGSRRFPGGLGAAEPAACWWMGGEERLSHTAPRVLPLLRRVGPIMESSFLSLNIMGPPLCSSLRPPGPASGTAAVVRGGGPGRS